MHDGHITVLTQSKPPVWDFRASESPDGKFIAFCRAKTGEAPAIWVTDADGKNGRLITRGIDDLAPITRAGSLFQLRPESAILLKARAQSLLEKWQDCELLVVERRGLALLVSGYYL